MKQLFFFTMVALLLSCRDSATQDANTATVKQVPGSQAFSTEGKTVVVYTTTDRSNLRLTVTDTVSFKQMGQPKETQICVFVDPGKQYQSFFGIGATLTDAAAETYAKIPKDKQAELLKAYFDKDNGIGYTVARTNTNIFFMDQWQSCGSKSRATFYCNVGILTCQTIPVQRSRSDGPRLTGLPTIQVNHGVEIPA